MRVIATYIAASLPHILPRHCHVYCRVTTTYIAASLPRILRLLVSCFDQCLVVAATPPPLLAGHVGALDLWVFEIRGRAFLWHQVGARKSLSRRGIE